MIGVEKDCSSFGKALVQVALIALAVACSTPVLCGASVKFFHLNWNIYSLSCIGAEIA